jgi:hypothetical protein
MGNKRASIYDASDELDLSAFAPQADPTAAAIPVDRVRAVAEASKFPSREAKSAQHTDMPSDSAEPATPATREPRRHRTGRNVQLSIKVSQETADVFYRLADLKGLVLGETLAQALAALERQLIADRPAQGH